MNNYEPLVFQCSKMNCSHRVVNGQPSLEGKQCEACRQGVMKSTTIDNMLWNVKEIIGDET